MSIHSQYSSGATLFPLAFAGLMVLAACSSKAQEPWSAKNDAVIKKNNVTGRSRDIPQVDIPTKVEPGKMEPLSAFPKVTIAPGVVSSLAWSKGAMVESLEMTAGSTYPEQRLNEELIMTIRDGSATCTLDGKTLELPKDALLYMTPGMTRSLKAGAQGAKVLEVYSPVRVDLLKQAGVTLPDGAKVTFPDQGITPSLRAGEVYDLNDIQLTPLTPVEPNLTYKRSGANSRLVWGKNAMLSFIRMDPNSAFALHIHPEDQLMYTTRGGVNEIVMDETKTMTGEENTVVYLPGGMVHGATMTPLGGDALDTFWPVRPDYKEWAEKQNAMFEQVIAPGTKPKKLADGFTFTEGPTWLHGKLYFSDMYFKDPANNDWTGSPARSRFIVMEPDGKWKVVSRGMQTNGTIALKNGNLMVCDMFGHRVIEMDPNTGKVVRVVLDKINGKPIDGPNDLVMDLKGGVYVTDPQFVPDDPKSQPGKQVYYIAPDGAAKLVIPAGEYAMPNGIEISPDGKTLYVNNSFMEPGGDFLYAYDIQPDGSLANKRKFAKYNLPEKVLSAPNPADRFASGADGSTVDMDGRIYEATYMGVQIWDKDGNYVGTIYCPNYPVSVTFGGPNYSTLYMVGEKEVWSIDTKVKGFRVPEGLN